MLFSSIRDAIFGPPHEWRAYEMGDKLVMRRKIKGEWQYRPLTEEETKEAAEWQAFQL